MEILIKTDGFSKNTKVSINGKEIDNPSFFGISVKFPGKVKLTYNEKITLEGGQASEMPKLSLWGSNFSDYDKATLPKNGVTK